MPWEARDLGGRRRSRAVSEMESCSRNRVRERLCRSFHNATHRTAHTDPTRAASSVKQTNGQNVCLWYLVVWQSRGRLPAFGASGSNTQQCPLLTQSGHQPANQRRLNLSGSSLEECFFRKSIVGRPRSATAKSLVNSGVAPRIAASAALILELRSEATTRGMVSHAP